MVREQELKKKEGPGLVKGDVDLTEGWNKVSLVVGGLFGGWMCGALGLGGGIIYNQLLMAMDAPPAVATATGMWLISFASLATLI